MEVSAIRDRLAYGLHALAGSALGSHSFTLDNLQDFLDLVLPLLGSPLVTLEPLLQLLILPLLQGLKLAHPHI